MARVVIENISKVFQGPKKEQIHAVREASLAVEDKEFMVLVGPSGCGKSTLLRMIAGLEEITKGTISIDGTVVNAIEPKDRDIAMVFQNYALYPHMTVYENMAFGLKLRKVPKAEIDQRVRETSEVLGLTPYLDRLPKALSGGQRQRVAVGRAIIRNPKVFLFDEPLSNLDAKMRVQMRLEISRLHDRLAATMIYVTHDQIEAMTMGDRIAVMKEGVIQQIADPMTLYNRPANLFVAGFIGSPPMNFFHGVIAKRESNLYFVESSQKSESARSGFEIELRGINRSGLEGYADRSVIMGLRPEDIHPAEEGGSSTRARPSEKCVIEAAIEMIEPMGADTHVYLASGQHTFIARGPSAFCAEPGSRRCFTLDVAKAHFFDPATEKSIRQTS